MSKVKMIALDTVLVSSVQQDNLNVGDHFQCDADTAKKLADRGLARRDTDEDDRREAAAAKAAEEARAAEEAAAAKAAEEARAAEEAAAVKAAEEARPAEEAAAAKAKQAQTLKNKADTPAATKAG